MVAKAVTMGRAPGTIMAAIIADHITNSSDASAGVQDGSMPFIDMFMSRHMATSMASIDLRLMHGESPGQRRDERQQARDDDAIAAHRHTVRSRAARHWAFSDWRQEKAFGPRRSNAMCLEERSDQSQLRPNAPVTTLRLA